MLSFESESIKNEPSNSYNHNNSNIILNSNQDAATSRELEKLLGDFESIRLGCASFLTKFDDWIGIQKEKIKEARTSHEKIIASNSGMLGVFNIFMMH